MNGIKLIQIPADGVFNIVQHDVRMLIRIPSDLSFYFFFCFVLFIAVWSHFINLPIFNIMLFFIYFPVFICMRC